jgi:hypothetical protein
MGLVPGACPAVDGGIITIWNEPKEAESGSMVHWGKLHTGGLWEVAFVSDLSEDEGKCRLGVFSYLQEQIIL